MKEAAAGYVTKGSTRAELVKTVRKVVEGGRERASLAEALAFDMRRQSEKLPHELLSDRELEVLCLIASGKTVGEIAQLLSLSDKTISTYRARILEDAKTSAELTHYAFQMDWPASQGLAGEIDGQKHAAAAFQKWIPDSSPSMSAL